MELSGAAANLEGMVRWRIVVGPVAGLAFTYVFFLLTPWGRAFDSLSYHGRVGAAWSVLSADRRLLETISNGTLTLALVTLVVLGGLRGRWRLGLTAGAAVVGSVLSAEVLKHLLPGIDHQSGQWRWLTTGSFPSGHAVVVTSLSLAMLTVSTPKWRRRLVGPLAAWAAIATTATVTLGWHRPSDVLGSLFLATAWHRGVGVERRPEERLRRLAPSPTATLWWAAACLLVLGAAAEGVLTGRTLGDVAPLAYLGSLAVLLAGVGVTLAQSREPVHSLRM